MKRIKNQKSAYRTPQDVREESYKTAKYIYLFLLLIFVMFILHFMFYDVYLLRGDGFVDSERESVTLEYDVKLRDIYVKNGDPIKLGQLAFTYDSFDFQSQYSEALERYTNLFKQKNAIEHTITQLKENIKVEESLHDFLKTHLENIQKLYAKKVLDVNKIVDAKINYATTVKNIDEFQSSLNSALESREQLIEATEELHATVQYFRKTYSDGTYFSNVQGVVGDLTAIPGTIVKRGDPIYIAYHKKRFLEVLFEDSSVPYRLNDPVLVDVPEAGWVIGRIVDVGLYAPTLPQEIQPKYRPPGRRRLVRVLIDDKYLKRLEVKTLLRVIKPLGLATICKFSTCKEHLIDEYKEYNTPENDG